MKGTTTSGFSFDIDNDIADDIEVLELVAAFDEGANPTVLPPLLTKLFGEAQKKALFEHCRENGRVKTSRVLTEVFDVFEAVRSSGNEADVDLKN